MMTVKLILTGDSFMTRRTPGDDPVQKQFRDWFQSADVRFTNLEVTTHKGESFPAPVSGGTWAMVSI
ncbi:hypothetical protein [Salisediminibacterium beveridgei]|uniref:hypothetical protein n=1 Tax=Salisediminibacterium beveridgei TaxID=632773 RepID=UPI000847F284|nr:hypothetical protein [Salisediminibacterium beveridgei]